MRSDVQEIFRQTPYEKQVMMFSATLDKAILPTCRKFTDNPQEILISSETKLSLHGIQQYHLKLEENTKNRKLVGLLDVLEFNQAIVFVNGCRRCKELDRLLQEQGFPSIAMAGNLDQKTRYAAALQHRILSAPFFHFFFFAARSTTVRRQKLCASRRTNLSARPSMLSPIQFPLTQLTGLGSLPTMSLAALRGTTPSSKAKSACSFPPISLRGVWTSSGSTSSSTTIRRRTPIPTYTGYASHQPHTAAMSFLHPKDSPATNHATAVTKHTAMFEPKLLFKTVSSLYSSRTNAALLPHIWF